ncbi:MAG: hypothetical protein M3198_15450 [Actinomycetota bacterium]|nr:hypothetical protein [Actinomycetota bacterium]
MSREREEEVSIGKGQEPGPAEEFDVTDNHIDEASDESFPASDPPSYSDPTERPERS